MDGPLSYDASTDPVDWSLDPSGGQDAFRILFNSAEADLSFGNLSSELFSIPEGFEEFLASHAGTVPYTNGNMGDQNFLPPAQQMQGAVTNAAGLAALGQAAEQMQQQQGGAGRRQLQHHVESSLTNIPDYFPVFSSLGLPMPQTLASRAPSPLPR